MRTRLMFALWTGTVSTTWTICGNPAARRARNARSARVLRKMRMRAALHRSLSLWTTLSGFESLPPTLSGFESLPPSHLSRKAHLPLLGTNASLERFLSGRSSLTRARISPPAASRRTDPARLGLPTDTGSGRGERDPPTQVPRTISHLPLTALRESVSGAATLAPDYRRPQCSRACCAGHLSGRGNGHVRARLHRATIHTPNVPAD